MKINTKAINAILSSMMDIKKKASGKISIIIIIIGSVVMAIALAKLLMPQPYDEMSDFKTLQSIAQKNSGMIGDYKNDDFDPTAFLPRWNFNDMAPDERTKYYNETKLDDGSLLREYWIEAIDKEIEVAP